MHSYITFWWWSYNPQCLSFSLVESCHVFWVVNHIAVYDWRPTGGGSSGCSTCVGIFKTLLNRSTFIQVHKLLKSGRSGEQYPFLLLLLMNDWILFRSVALGFPVPVMADVFFSYERWKVYLKGYCVHFVHFVLATAVFFFCNCSNLHFASSTGPTL